MEKNKEKQIREKIAKYIAAMVQKYEKLKREDLAINPFLAGALKLDNEEKTYKFFITQRLQRGIVTSFGSLLYLTFPRYSEMMFARNFFKICLLSHNIKMLFLYL